MTLRVETHPEASAELAEAAVWIARGSTAKGKRFIDAVEAKVQQLLTWPEWAPVSRHSHESLDVREAKVLRVDYRIVCFVDGDALSIVAIAHTKRKPGYWRGRLPG